jgi:hypothetical protein
MVCVAFIWIIDPEQVSARGPPSRPDPTVRTDQRDVTRFVQLRPRHFGTPAAAFASQTCGVFRFDAGARTGVRGRPELAMHMPRLSEQTGNPISHNGKALP